MRDSKHSQLLREAHEDFHGKYAGAYEQFENKFDNFVDFVCKHLYREKINFSKLEKIDVGKLKSRMGSQTPEDIVKDIICSRTSAYVSEIMRVELSVILLKKASFDLDCATRNYISCLEDEIENLEKLEERVKEKIEKKTGVTKAETRRREAEVKKKRAGEKIEKLDIRREPRKQKLKKLRQGSTSSKNKET